MNSMCSFLIKRLLGVLPVLFFLPFITFFLMHLVPGNYFDSLRMNPQISPQTIERYEQMYHLKEPVLVQYGYWLKNIARLDFGYSFTYQQPVTKLLISRFGNTLLLTLTAFLLAWAAAIPLGLWAGLSKNSLTDKAGRLVAYFGLSMPNFLLCLLLLWGISR